MTSGLRIRQVVFACDSTSTIDVLQYVLGLEKPYADPGVGAFGLVNGVFALGDQFVEIVVPVSDTAPARRFLDRSDKGGYMAIFQVPDIKAARDRLDRLGMRRVWNSDHEVIGASHIHPVDIGAAIVSIDEPRPATSWLWGGPDWMNHSAMGAVTGITLTSPDPEALTRKWASALGAEPGADGVSFATLDGPVEVIKGEKEEIAAYSFRLPDAAAVRERASEKGLEVSATGFVFAGIRMEL